MINTILANQTQEETPAVGTPCTFLSYSDRSPGVVVEVISDRKIVIASVEYTAKLNPNSRDGKWEYGDCITYDYFPDLTKSGSIYTKRKNGTWQRQGCAYAGGHGSGRVAIGYMERYRDPSF